MWGCSIQKGTVWHKAGAEHKNAWALNYVPRKSRFGQKKHHYHYCIETSPQKGNILMKVPINRSGLHATFILKNVV